MRQHPLREAKTLPATARVRQAKLRDVPALGSFFRRAWKEAGPGALGFTGANEQAIREISSPEFLSQRIASPNVRIFLAEEGSDVVGFASTRKEEPNRAELSGIVVLKSAQGRGLGTRLMRAAEGYVFGLGVRTMLVKTESFNAKAIGFYEKNGYAETETASERVGRVKVPLVVLEKRLRRG